MVQLYKQHYVAEEKHIKKRLHLDDNVFRVSTPVTYAVESQSRQRVRGSVCPEPPLGLTEQFHRQAC